MLKDLDLQIPIYESTMDQAHKIAEEKIKKGTEVVICRGGTAYYLRGLIDVPVVDIRHGFLDIYRAVKNTKRDDNEIAVIGFHNLCEAGELYNEVADKQISIYEIKSEMEFEDAVDRAIKDGNKCMIGGFQLEDMCLRKGVDYVPGDADESSILSAIKEAFHDLKIEEERKKRFESLKNILENMSEGIISFDKHGNVSYINKNLKRIMGESYIENEKFEEIFSIKKHLKSQNSTFNNILEYRGKKLIYNVITFRVDEKVNNVLISVQDVEKIKNAEQKIRQDYIRRGYYAKHDFNDLLGSSEILKETISRAKKYAKSESTILITGETGTGKEIFAQSIHRNSLRKNSQFVAINCAALPKNILESELFGYVKGAFTGALGEGKEGIFEIADGGTVFLDEISELPLDVQAKLLRIIQEREICRLGDNKIRKVDVRLIAAANKSLYEMVKENKFREDLYYRICVLELKIPPLRQRENDAYEILLSTLKKNSSNKLEVDKEIEKIVSSYNWPGNVRELLNIAERLEIEIEGSKLYKKDMLKVIGSNKHIYKENNNKIQEETMIYKNDIRKDKKESKDNVNKIKDIINDEKSIIEMFLNKNSGNRTKTAADLKISTTTLWRKMKKYELL